MCIRDRAKAVARRLKSIDSDKRYFEINCSTIKNVKQFFNQLVIPFMQDRDATILFDECSEIPKDVSMALLTILNPNAENRTSFSSKENEVRFSALGLRMVRSAIETSLGISLHSSNRMVASLSCMKGMTS